MAGSYVADSNIPRPDFIYKIGSKGQQIKADVGIDTTGAEKVWFEILEWTDTDETHAIEYEAESSTNYIIYTLLGTEFTTPGYYWIIACVKIDVDHIYYSENKRMLQVKRKFE